MRIVIQCASSKTRDAPNLTTRDGKPVLFVARPSIAPSSGTHVYARPDDISDDGMTWRERLLEYNKIPNANPLKLLHAYRLYKNKIYKKLVDKFGLAQMFILSAGWGLISADFLTPNYDITFSAIAEKYKKRRENDDYSDFCMIPNDGDDIVFLGCKDYLPQFSELTSDLKGAKLVFFNLKENPVMPPGFILRRYETTARQNWHYGCARDLIEGKITISPGELEKI